MKINDFFEQHQIDLKDKRLLVAASAGPDSMALLDMLVNLQKQLSFTVLRHILIINCVRIAHMK